MPKEMIDIFDVNYNHIGTADKDEAHCKGLWHRTFHCWIVRSNGTVLVQLRSKNKKVSPNKLGLSGGGHLNAGEKLIDGIREIEEEIGLKVNVKNLHELGFITRIADRKIKGENYSNREFVHVYLLKDDTPIEQYTMQEDEVDGIFEIDIQDALKIISDETQSAQISGYVRSDNSNTKKLEKRTITYDDFAPFYKSYYLKVFIMAERLLEGKKYLAI